ncbi:STY0301 family protein [Pseudomonas sp. RIT-PI-AD]|uniref:STY0301 family protein n=1 Tax=Pseudomonas sp. RIT-PI-AD TaxID=3035294 RepID=UPI0021DB2D67|nr:STY0301 family protein [Pseudomonas sp. RIT-PI-AD]
MSSNDARPLLSALFGLMLLTGCAHAEIACPAKAAAGGVLSGAEVFDGPPEELASLVPDGEDGVSWDLKGYHDSPRELYLVCEYADGAKQNMLLPKDVSECTVQGKGEVSARCN